MPSIISILHGLELFGYSRPFKNFVFYCNIMEAGGQGSPAEQKIAAQVEKPNVEKPVRKTKSTKREEEDSKGRTQSSTYYWNFRENRSYLKFLKEKGSIFQLDAIQRKKEKSNLKLSKYVKTRTPTQCHTHHQKMMIKYGSVERAIVEMQLKYGSKSGQREKKKNLNPTVLKVEERMAENIQWQPYECKLEHTGESDILKEQNDFDYIYY